MNTSPLPSHLRVTPIAIINNGIEIATIYTSDRHKAAHYLADLVEACEAIKKEGDWPAHKASPPVKGG